MNYRNMSLMDSLDEILLEEDQTYNKRNLLVFATAILYVGSAVLSFLTICSRCRHAPSPPPSPNTWNAVGYYDLRTPQTLTKLEREAAAQHGAKTAILYEKIYASGAHAWRYSLNGHDWYYPTRTAVIRRGRTDSGDVLRAE